MIRTDRGIERALVKLKVNMENLENKDTCLLNLPSEILEVILGDINLDYLDICRTSCTCKYLWSVCLSNELWKRKVIQRWPELLDQYDLQSRSSQNWQDEFTHRHNFSHKVHNLLAPMSGLYHNKQEISKEHFSDFVFLTEKYEHSAKYVIDELLSICQDSNRYGNLTKKYYAAKALRYLHHFFLKQQWESFLQLPPDKQSLETGSVLIAQWCQPTSRVTQATVESQLIHIATLVRQELNEHQPKHPACTPLPTCSSTGLLRKSLWSPANCRTVLETINYILYKVLGFHGNSNDYYNPNNSYIDMVLTQKSGIPITLSVAYMGVAARLGVRCEPVNFPSHFLIRWLEHPQLSADERFTYIDAFNSGKFLTQHECTTTFNVPGFSYSADMFQEVECHSILQRMARNLVNIGRTHGRVSNSMLTLRNSIELYLLITPSDVERRLLLARVNLHLNIDLEEVIDNLQQVADMDQAQMSLVAYLMEAAYSQLRDQQLSTSEPKPEPKKRSKHKNVQFSTGMVMRHKRYDYMCVVYGWDYKCQASTTWIHQMGVNNLPNQQHQPFYNVMVEDGSNRYAAQENLVFPDNPKEVVHSEVGRYFQEFTGLHYIPNDQLLVQYPEDVQFTKNFINNYYDASSHQ